MIDRRGNWVQAAAMLAGLVGANAGLWAWATVQLGGDSILLGTALLAYVFGLRHAVDADHIAAIDNATRKLIETNEPAALTGLYFSLGHATVIVLTSLAIALTTAGLQESVSWLRPAARATATAVSALSLFALALANCVVLLSVVRLLAAARRGERAAEGELARMLTRRGLLGKLLRGAFRLIAKSWHMFPLGFLFGLGFDTATEIGLLALSASQAAHGLPLATVLVFPALFTAGMAMVDTLDALLIPTPSSKRCGAGNRC